MTLGALGALALALNAWQVTKFLARNKAARRAASRPQVARAPTARRDGTVPLFRSPSENRQTGLGALSLSLYRPAPLGGAGAGSAGWRAEKHVHLVTLGRDFEAWQRSRGVSRSTTHQPRVWWGELSPTFPLRCLDSHQI